MKYYFSVSNGCFGRFESACKFYLVLFRLALQLVQCFILAFCKKSNHLHSAHSKQLTSMIDYLTLGLDFYPFLWLLPSRTFLVTLPILLTVFVFPPYSPFCESPIPLLTEGKKKL